MSSDRQDDPLFRAPEPLSAAHDASAFRNGRHPSLDDWLTRRALSAEGASARTYVVCPRAEPTRVAGYFALAAHQARMGDLPTAKLRRNMPDPIPTILLARLAVDLGFAGAGLGTALLCEALRLSVGTSRHVGVRAVVVHAIDADAAAFYRRRGFLDSPSDPSVLLMPMERAEALVLTR